MEFRKSLAKYYHKWHSDSLDSAQYLRSLGNDKAADEYERSAAEYAIIIEDNREAIEFFSKDDNAFKLDSALPKQWRGYK